MLARKLGEIGSNLYRAIIFPFVRIGIECKTKSIMRQRTYMNKGAVLRGKNYVGKNTIISNSDFGFGSYISTDGNLSNARVGKYCSIGPNLSTIGGSHPVKDFVSTHPAFYSKNNGAGFTYLGVNDADCMFNEDKFVDAKKGYFYEIGNDVWIGANVSLCQGIHIGDGAVVGAGSLVLKDLEPYGIYAGVPAKKIGQRFSDDEIDKLLLIKWWDKDEAFIKEHVSEFRNVGDFLSNNR